MSRQHLNISGLVFLLLLILGIWFWLRSAKMATKGIEEAEQATTRFPAQAQEPGATLLSDEVNVNSRMIEKSRSKFGGLTLDEFAARAFSAKIEFYGKVVDQFGHPVPQPDVIYNAATSVVDDGGKNSATQGNAEGNIRITGLTGGSLYVEVRKTGYYRTEKSLGSFRYGTPSGQYPAPTEDKPFIFVLQKMGETVSLVQFEKDIHVPRNGSPTDISLVAGRVVATGQGDLRVEVWTNDHIKNSQRRYDWKCRFSVPGGGLVERRGEFDFEAPLDNYLAFDEINMPQEAQRWQPQAHREYFLKLSDNRFARISITVRAGGEHFITLKSYLNQALGNRNLEFDPAKAIKP